MPSGFRVDKEAWVKDYDGAKTLAQEIVQLIQDRNVNNSTGGPEASRKTATARRKIGTLGTEIDKLLSWLDTEDAAGLSESEKNRRRDMVFELKNRREQMQYAIKRTVGSQERDLLLQGGTSSRTPAQGAKETEATAELDGAGLLQLQQQVMKNQDQELEHMEKAVVNTKHIALAIGEEVDLQTRLLDDLHDDVDVAQSRTKAATARIRQILNNSSHWKGGLCIFVLIVTLVLVLVLVVKLSRLF